MDFSGIPVQRVKHFSVTSRVVLVSGLTLTILAVGCLLDSCLLHETTLFCSGGDAGAETITWDNAGDFMYLMSVYDYSHSSATHIVESEARIALYSNNSGSPITMEVPTTETNTYSRSKGFLFVFIAM